jgi:hypothetical protein
MIKLFEKYNNIGDVKDMIFKKAVLTGKINIVDFFLKKGYDINTEDALLHATYDDDMFRFFLKKGVDLEAVKDDYDIKKRFSNIDVQRTLIDFGKEQIIYDTVGFNGGLKGEPKYRDIIEQYEDAERYNL